GVGAAADDVAVGDGGGHDRDLVGAGQEEPAAVLHRADAAADAERHEADVGGAGDDVQDDAAVLVGGGHVEEHQVVRAGGVIGLGLLHRVAGVDEVDELHALDDPAVLHVEAWDQPGLERAAHGYAASLSAWAGSMVPL